MQLVPELTWRIPGRLDSALDPRVVKLLAGIRTHATLRAAAAELGVSYRAAWGLLGEAGERLGGPLVDMQRGRGATLTAAGERVVAAHEKAVEAIRQLGLEIELPARTARAPTSGAQGLHVAASHDLLLAEWCERWAVPQGVVTDLAFSGSLESLAAFARGDADVAGFHLAAPADEGDAAAFRRLLDPRRDALIRFATREQGLIVQRGNPKRLSSISDVAGRHARFVNRQRGSGTRMLTDHLLREARVDPSAIRGYTTEEYSHLAVAATVAAGRSDAGLGLRAAASRFGLDFVPLSRETYWLAVRQRKLASDIGRRLRDGLAGPSLRRAMRGLPGYSIRDAGAVMPIGAASTT
jgi:putative molybdopterin biosynthesis protein